MLTQARLKELLHYNPETGMFTWAKSRGTKKKGALAGAQAKYLNIGIDGKTYYGHRLAFLYMLGYMPEEVDHEDTDKTNLKWANLRDSTRSSNQANKPVSQRNLLGVKGVSVNGKGYRAQLTCAGKQYYSKTFKTIEEAAIEYARLAETHHGEFARY